MKGRGTTLPLFRPFQDSVLIVDLAASVNQHLTRTLALGPWAMRTIQMVARGCFLFVCAHECAHIVRGHVIARPLLDREDSALQSRIRSGLEIEADVMAYCNLTNFAKLAAFEASEALKFAGLGDLQLFLEEDGSAAFSL
jgi:hypothetical protein